MLEQQLTVLFDELKALIVAKNHDYGNSYEQSVERYGEVVYLIRIEDKLNRYRAMVVDGEMAMVDEAVMDTLKDIIGYTALEISRRGKSE